MESSPPDTTLTCTPIGTIKTSLRVKFDAPHQPQNACDNQSVIELLPGHNFENALRDLEGFDRIWVVWWFHKNTTWRPLVLPPRGSSKRRGVFATRSPHRPNPIGITAVPLIHIRGRELVIGNCDLVDGTPILDIKPYIPTVDSFPEAKTGWLAEVEAELAAPPRFQVALSPLATDQLKWLKDEHTVDFFPRARELLCRDPSPHRTRRISRIGDGSFRMGCGAWRLFFCVDGDRILITSVGRGYPLKLLHAEGYNSIPDHAAQIAFDLKWPGSLE